MAGTRHSAGVAAIGLMMCTPAAWAHFCGPFELSVGVGQEVFWQITADRTEDISDYTPQLSATDTAIATVSPALPFRAHHGDFTFKGITVGETTFSSDWFYAPTGFGGTCSVKINVTEKGVEAPIPPERLRLIPIQRAIGPLLLPYELQLERELR